MPFVIYVFSTLHILSIYNLSLYHLLQNLRDYDKWSTVANIFIVNIYIHNNRYDIIITCTMTSYEASEASDSDSDTSKHQ